MKPDVSDDRLAKLRDMARVVLGEDKAAGNKGVQIRTKPCFASGVPQKRTNPC